MNIIDKKEDSLHQRQYCYNLTLYTQEKFPMPAGNTNNLFF
jgi:hypothetical protein